MKVIRIRKSPLDAAGVFSGPKRPPAMVTGPGFTRYYGSFDRARNAVAVL